MNLNKVFLQTQFGKPHTWSEQYFANVRKLEALGWSLKVFTPNQWKSEGNIEIIPMRIEDFNRLIFDELSLHIDNYILPESGVPAKVVSDYYPAYGQIFQKYIRDFDFWAHTNWDMVYGRLDHFLPDSLLETCDIWSDDVARVNGIFTVYRNRYSVNNLFRQVPNWESMFQSHLPCAFDEVHMSRAVNALCTNGGGSIRFKYPHYFGFHSYDRLIQHRPEPNIYFESDGALIERFEDSISPHISFPKGHFGREIMSFHFNRTKQWPRCLLASTTNKSDEVLVS